MGGMWPWIFFGFMRCREFLVTKAGELPAVLAGDVAVDSHSNPSMLCVFLRRAKCDPFGNGANIYIGVTGSALCPVAAILRYLAVRLPHPGLLMVRKDTSPLTRKGFVHQIRGVLSKMGMDASEYAGHSLRIRAATTAALAGIPEDVGKMGVGSLYAVYPNGRTVLGTSSTVTDYPLMLNRDLHQ